MSITSPVSVVNIGSIICTRAYVVLELVVTRLFRTVTVSVSKYY